MKTSKLMLLLVATFMLIFTSCQDDLVPVPDDDALILKNAKSERVVPFKGEYVAHPKAIGGTAEYVVIEINCEGNATHLGKSTLHGIQNCYILPPVPDGRIDGVELTLTAANGDKITGWYDGWGFPNSEGVMEFAGTMYATSGTGRFEGVTGELPYEGYAQGDEGRCTYQDGYLVFPKH